MDALLCLMLMWSVIIFFWVGFSGSSDLSPSYLFANKIRLFILCCIIVCNHSKPCTNIPSGSISLAFSLPFLLFFWLTAINPASPSSPPLSFHLHFIFPPSSHPSQSQVHFLPWKNPSLLPPPLYCPCSLPFSFSNPPSPSLLSPLFSWPW